MTRLGAVIIVLGMAAFLILPTANLQLVSAVLIAIALGLVNIGILIPFVFALNNTEKLYAIVSSNILISLISLFQNSDKGNYLQDRDDLVLSSVVLIVALASAIFFKRAAVSTKFDKKITHTPLQVYVILFFNCAFVILCKGIGTGILNITAENFGNSVIIWYYIGGIIGCLIYLIIYALTSNAYILLGNISLALVSFGLLCNAFRAESQQMPTLFGVLLGAGNTIGMINIYYIIGVVGKKYNSMRYLKLSIVLIGVCGGLSGIVLGNIIHNTNTSMIAFVASIISVSILMLFMILSPLFAREQYYNEWGRDSEMTEIDNEQMYLFKEYRLSKREIEVCKLLLEGYTLRQISAILSIAYSTVNTHCTYAYRKLNINSRTELILLFKDYKAPH